MSNLDKKLDFYIQHGYNVLFSGHQGVGKSATVLEAFKRNKLKYAYYSASTMDPWVDFIGVPKEKVMDNGKSTIELIRPAAIANDEIEAIFFDELNRSPKKIRNAVMELIQFKSINGHKLNNLKVIWAAINPDKTDDEDHTFDVEKLDPAQKDRFQVYIELPFKLDIAYFSNKYTPVIANVANEWWSKIDKKIQRDISPRRVDYALDLYFKGGDIRDVLPKQSNVGSFVSALKAAPLRQSMEAIVKTKNKEEAMKIISNENSFYSAKDILKSDPSMREFFMPLFNSEQLATELVKPDKATFDCIAANIKSYKDILEEIAAGDAELPASKTAKRLLDGKSSLSMKDIKMTKSNTDINTEHNYVRAIIETIDINPYQVKDWYRVLVELSPFAHTTQTNIFEVFKKTCSLLIDSKLKLAKDARLSMIKVMNGCVLSLPNYDWSNFLSTEINNTNGVIAKAITKIESVKELKNEFIFEL